MATQYIRVEFHCPDADRLAQEFEYMGKRTWKEISGDVRDSAKIIQAKWRAHARGTARRHGRLYPGTITTVMNGPFEASIGPESAMPQGGMGMGFEYGSVNQPPHMDANITIDREFPRFVEKIERSVEKVIGT